MRGACNGFDNPEEYLSWDESVKIVEQKGVKTNRNISWMVLTGDKAINCFGDFEWMRVSNLMSRACGC